MKRRPLSFDQERMWVIERLTPGAVERPALARLRGALAPAAFRQALAVVMQRHEGLRTSFPVDDGVPHQLIADHARSHLRLVDLTGLAQDRLAALDHLVDAESTKVFDLESGPLLRVTLIRLDRDDHVLAVAIHHLAADLWSMAILWSELSTAYEAASAGVPTRLPTITRQPSDLAGRARDRLTPARLAYLRAVWRARLDGVRPVDLPTDHPRPALPNLGSQGCWASLDRQCSAGLRALAATEAVTLFVTLLTAVAALIVRWARHDDLVVASVHAGRRDRHAERVIGMLTQRLIIRLDAAGDPTVRELLRRTREAVLDSLDTIDVPYAEIVKLVDPRRDREPSPLRQIGLSVHNVPTRPPRLSGLELMDPPGPAPEPRRGVSEADLWFEVFDDGHGPLRLRLQVDDLIFEPGTLHRTTERLATVLSSMVARPEAHLSELDLIGPVEQARLDELGRRWAEAGAAVVVVDERLAAVPIGAVGELCLVGTNGALRRTGRMVRFRWDGLLETARAGGASACGIVDRAVTPVPSAGTRQAVAELVGALLSTTQVRGDDNFFQLGGASVDAARLVAEIGRRFGVAPSLYAVMTAGTIDGIAVAIERARAARTGDLVRPDQQDCLF